MELQSEKCVLVLDGALPLGVLANTAAILGITLGKHLPGAVGPDVPDADGNVHLGIIATPVPVLKVETAQLKALRQKLYQPEYGPLLVVDFSDVAQGCNVYDAFQEKAAGTPEADWNYLGLGICGPKKAVNKLTGNLPLLR